MDALMVVQLIAEGGAAVGVTFVGVKYMNKMFTTFKEKRREREKKNLLIDGLLEAVPAIRTQLSDIAKEIHPNGGSSIRDAIDRIEARQIIRDQTNEAQMSAIGLAYWRSDKSGRCTYASPSLCRTLGTTESSIKGNNWATLIHPEDREAVSEEWVRSTQENRVFNMNYRFVREDNGETVSVRGHSVPLINTKTGAIEGFWGHIVEATS